MVDDFKMSTKQKKSANNKLGHALGLILFTKFNGWIVGPVIVAIFAGRWLDKKFNADPWLTLLLVGIAFAVSILGIVRESMKSIKEEFGEEEEKKLSSKEGGSTREK